MKSFQPGFLESVALPPRLVQTIRLLGEFKGKQDMFARQHPQVLGQLREAAVIQSTESSNRLEGVRAPYARIRDLVQGKTTPRNRSEQEIAGYRDVLSTIHVHHEGMTFTPGLVLQFHRDLYQFLPGQGGRWKLTDNDITETRPDGSTFVRFKPVPAFLTAKSMEELHEGYARAREAQEVDPLILIPAYVLDFLCIHPFLDGNGRMARLLTLLLLYREGYEVGRFISLEQVVEANRDGYYGSLYESSQGWHEGLHSLVPWLEYFLGVVLLGAYRQLEARTGELTATKGAKKEMVLNAIARLPEEFRWADLEQICVGISHSTIRRVLDELKAQGVVQCASQGRDAVWRKS
ncbi:MAG: Fic family protein [Desulfovibrio sp.]|jgi:Fic family protein|nr:Fic family protein [Desulfovibrio sp.]